MKLNWHLVDQILSETKSSAQQLLEWMNDPEVRDHHFPCTSGHLYLDEYTFVQAIMFDDNTSISVWNDNVEIEITVPQIAEGVGIYDFWSKWCINSKFRTDMRGDFKRRYHI